MIDITALLQILIQMVYLIVGVFVALFELLWELLKGIVAILVAIFEAIPPIAWKILIQLLLAIGGALWFIWMMFASLADTP